MFFKIAGLVTILFIIITFVSSKNEKTKEVEFCSTVNGKCVYSMKEVPKNSCHETTKNINDGKCLCNTVEVPC